MKLEQQREAFFNRVPGSELLDMALRSGDNRTPLFFFNEITDKSTDIVGASLALGRLGKELEQRFNVQGEVSIFFTPWPDLHRATYNSIAQQHVKISNEAQKRVFKNIRFTPSKKITLIVSEHRDTTEKCAQWNRESESGSLVIPICTLDMQDVGARETLIRTLVSYLHDRDLYKKSDAAYGWDFYGRQGVLSELQSHIARRQYVALLGLRRLGKTSIVKQLGDINKQKGIVVAYADCQAMEASSLESFAENIFSMLIDQLRTVRDSGSNVWLGNEAEQSATDLTVIGLSQKIRRLAARNPDLTLVLALDEIETLFSISKDSPDAVRGLLGALRSAAQGQPNVTLLLAGVVNDSFDDSQLGREDQVDNPLFGQVESLYLTPFSEMETAEMLTGLGDGMLISWSESAIEAVHQASGGVPYLARELASDIRKMRLNTSDSTELRLSEVMEIQASDVEQAIPAWKPRAGRIWTGITKMLKTHHPHLYLLLEDDPTEEWVSTWAAEDEEVHRAALTLCNLGLFGRDENRGFFFTDSYKSLRALESGGAGPVDQPLLKSSLPTETLEEMMKAGESQTVEFKETCRWDLRKQEKSKAIEHEVVKTVSAFLHADGGVLLVGVNDHGKAAGLGPDLRIFENSPDRLERWLLRDLLGSAFGIKVVADYVKAALRQVRGRPAIVVEVRPYNGVAETKDGRVYRRLGNQSIQLKAQDLEEFRLSRNTAGA